MVREHEYELHTPQFPASWRIQDPAVSFWAYLTKLNQMHGLIMTSDDYELWLEVLRKDTL
jgi:hypothetical protein